MQRRHQLSSIAAALCAAMLALPAHAAVSAEEARQLGTTLTPFGAEKAGNKEGTIPAYAGGLTGNMPAPRSGLPPPLFTQEKPILQIKADNVDQHADKLTEGFKVLVKKYPGFRIDVYPTHRTFAAPQFFNDNSIWNATHAKVEKEAVLGHKGGIPFPIPKNGLEVVFNTQWNWRSADREINAETWFVSAAGKRSLATGNILIESFPHFYTDRKDPWEGRLRGAGFVEITAPAYSAGEKTLFLGPVDPIGSETQGWTFLTGQRRLRKIPNVQYDVPFPYTSGNTNYDDAAGFNGATDRYDWKLLGKKEMFVPYNNNNMTHVADLDQLMGPQYLNPDHLRFELHRVWVVEATLRPGARHTVPKRRLYIDEDSWNIISTDQWDAKDQFWKSNTLLTWVYPSVPVQLVASQLIYNVQAKSYALQNAINRAPGGASFKPYPPEFFSPQALERAGVR
jgi:hypothetical protein